MEQYSKIQKYVVTRNIKDIASLTGNLYKSIVAIYKRSEHLDLKLKQIIEDKITKTNHKDDSYDDDNIINIEKISILKNFDALPKTTSIAIDEFINDKLVIK